MRGMVLTLLGISLAECLYLLLILYVRLARIYSRIWGWRLIFIGFSLLVVEILWGCVIVGGWSDRVLSVFGVSDVDTGVASMLFAVFMLAKVSCYCFGFTLWERQRRRLLEEPPTLMEKVDKLAEGVEQLQTEAARVSENLGLSQSQADAVKDGEAGEAADAAAKTPNGSTPAPAVDDVA